MLPPKRHGSKSECTAYVVCALTWIKNHAAGDGQVSGAVLMTARSPSGVLSPAQQRHR